MKAELTIQLIQPKKLTEYGEADEILSRKFSEIHIETAGTTLVFPFADFLRREEAMAELIAIMETEYRQQIDLLLAPA